MAKLLDREWVSKAPKLRHVTSFDGIRGFGVVGVMLGHSLPKGTLSWAGIVDVFFVVSGFLITTLLLQEHRSTGRIDLRRFYARRFLRLLPALYVMLAGAVAVGLIVRFGNGRLANSEQTLSALAKECVAAVAYVYNIVFPVHNGPWMDHLWTLSVEEQFYLVVGVAALVTIAKGGIRVATWVLVALVAVIQLSRLFLIPGPVPSIAVMAWVQRPDSLMIGMLGAIASAHLSEPLSPRARRRLSIAGWVGTVVLFGSVWVSTGVAARLGIHHAFVPEQFEMYLREGRRPPGFYWIQWGHSAAAWASLCITLCCFRVPEWWPNRFLSWRFWVWTGGLLSYSLYLWHVPVQTLLHAFLPTSVPKPLYVVLAVGLPFLVAYPSYRFVETRALRIKARFAVEESKPVPGATESTNRTAGVGGAA